MDQARDDVRAAALQSEVARTAPAAPAGAAAHPRAAHRRCISRGPAATWTKAGRAGCSSSTSSTCTPLHNADVRAGKLRAEVRRDHPAGPERRATSSTATTAPTIRPEYRGGIGDEGVERAEAVRRRRRHADHARRGVRSRDREASPCRSANLKRGLTRDQHFAPGTILKIEVDTTHPLGYGMAAGDLRLLQQQPVLRAASKASRRRRRPSSRAIRTTTSSRRAGCAAKS